MSPGVRSVLYLLAAYAVFWAWCWTAHQLPDRDWKIVPTFAGFVILEVLLVRQSFINFLNFSDPVYVKLK